jgi:peptidoglycan/xylan/chitin deacetylase (PgdA/CDA1 family)
MFGESVHKGPGRRRSIALTFDDGPSESTPELLEFLAQRGIRATFFQCGANILRCTDIARRVRDEGHEIGNHTFSHPALGPDLKHRPLFKSRQFIYDELAKAQLVIRDHLDLEAKLMRAPYGLRWFGVSEAQERLGLLGVMWTVIGHDWHWNAEQVSALLLARARPGGIICLHDGRDIKVNPNISVMLTAIRHVIPVLQHRGYQFETVSEILQPDLPVL